eukprot:CAMPEP_0172643602 /NCGR_PEP_ID=MMETSP1068-20121228/237597_1 /TAXON_ID=35684 /ORGANISM="Pseudopedinella elastica, Strain CCMP716" /LENGTH=75 /DNA_ID=CAMNT_0013457693 /DNA_START=109 /DNA_END=336 /DNA_ORIENTATION=+
MACQAGGEQRVKFKIYPDGRVEETVIGVKGQDCLKITEELNEKLGTVLATEATEEMSEKPVENTNNVYEQNKNTW